jgi:hypothetical protein
MRKLCCFESETNDPVKPVISQKNGIISYTVTKISRLKLYVIFGIVYFMDFVNHLVLQLLILLLWYDYQ